MYVNDDQVTKRGGHTTVGGSHSRVCEVEESDTTPAKQSRGTRLSSTTYVSLQKPWKPR